MTNQIAKRVTIDENISPETLPTIHQLTSLSESLLCHQPGDYLVRKKVNYDNGHSSLIVECYTIKKDGYVTQIPKEKFPATGLIHMNFRKSLTNLASHIASLIWDGNPLRIQPSFVVNSKDRVFDVFTVSRLIEHIKISLLGANTTSVMKYSLPLTPKYSSMGSVNQGMKVVRTDNDNSPSTTHISLHHSNDEVVHVLSFSEIQ